MLNFVSDHITDVLVAAGATVLGLIIYDSANYGYKWLRSPAAPAQQK